MQGAWMYSHEDIYMYSHKDIYMYSHNDIYMYSHKYNFLFRYIVLSEMNTASTVDSLLFVGV